MNRADAAVCRCRGAPMPRCATPPKSTFVMLQQASAAGSPPSGGKSSIKPQSSSLKHQASGLKLRASSFGVHREAPDHVIERRAVALERGPQVGQCPARPGRACGLLSLVISPPHEPAARSRSMVRDLREPHQGRGARRQGDHPGRRPPDGLMHQMVDADVHHKDNLASFNPKSRAHVSVLFHIVKAWCESRG